MAKFLDTPSKGLIYLIDDDPSFLMSLAHVLRIEGYEVVAFKGASEFLEAALGENAIVICDMRMPKLTGLDLQEALRDMGVKFPIIFVSGESTVNQAVAAMKGGALDFLTKPFAPTDLLRKVADTFAAMEQSGSASEAIQSLSPREYEAFRYFIEGHENAHVAEQMGVKVSTVKEFKTNIFKKLGVSTVIELIRLYRDQASSTV